MYVKESHKRDSCHSKETYITQRCWFLCCQRTLIPVLLNIYMMLHSKESHQRDGKGSHKRDLYHSKMQVAVLSQDTNSRVNEHIHDLVLKRVPQKRRKRVLQKRPISLKDACCQMTRIPVLMNIYMILQDTLGGCERIKKTPIPVAFVVYIHIYVHINMCTWMYVHIYTYVHVHIYIYIHMYVYVCIYAHKYICTYVYIYMWIYKYVYVCLYEYTCIHIYIYLHKYVYTRYKRQ